MRDGKKNHIFSLADKEEIKMIKPHEKGRRKHE